MSLVHDTSKKARSTPQFITPLTAYKNSIPVPDRYLEGFWSIFEPRINLAHANEATRVLEYRQSLANCGFQPARAGSIARVSPFNSIIFSEAEPEKVLLVGPLSDLAFLENNGINGERFLKPGCEEVIDEAKLMREHHITLQQLKAKHMLEMLNANEDAIQYIEGYDVWTAQVKQMDALDGYIFKTIEEYMDNRFHSANVAGLSMCCDFCYSLKLTDEEYKACEPIRQFGVGIGALGNDWVSAEIEWIVKAESGAELPYVNGVFVIMHNMGLSFSESKEILKSKAQQKEREFWDICRQVEARFNSFAVRQYITIYMLLIGGSLCWHMNHARYDVDPDHPFYPRPDYTISDYQRLAGLRILPGKIDCKEKLCRANDTSLGFESNECLNAPQTSTRVTKKVQQVSKPGSQSWLSAYHKLSDEIILEPYKYITSLPSKRIQKSILQALNAWYIVPNDTLELTDSVINILLNSSLM
ncbi:hypothetical protein TWF730_005058 [Orbilia blumenaviensis]|uniref:Uncharacterized protein n=1 Tax=Orbilia blumenaviensis TaxID=1796055 RepID=A0AAV9VHL0_9PEZI